MQFSDKPFVVNTPVNTKRMIVAHISVILKNGESETGYLRMEEGKTEEENLKAVNNAIREALNNPVNFTILNGAEFVQIGDLLVKASQISSIKLSRIMPYTGPTNC